MAYKPDGFPSVSPYILVQDGQGLIDLLAAVFGATPERRIDHDGRIAHAEMRIDDSVVMLADAFDKWVPVPTWVHLYVPDVDATYQKALALGATSVQAPQQRPNDPDKRGGVADKWGNQWWISTQT